MLTQREIAVLESYLRWLRGFEESALYQDYQEVEGFTDEEYTEARDTLCALLDRNREPQKKESLSCQ